MKRWQSKERIRRLRTQQKSKNIPYHEQIMGWSENCIKNDEYFLHSYDSKRKKAKFRAIVFGILSLTFRIVMFFYPNPWIMFLSWFTLLATALLVWQYLFYRDRMPFWMQKLKEDSKFLQSARDM
jgi:hypothetical protein